MSSSIGVGLIVVDRAIIPFVDNSGPQDQGFMCSQVGLKDTFLSIKGFKVDGLLAGGPTST